MVGGFIAFFIIMWLVVVGILAVQCVAMWKIYAKAGLEGWKALIPLYNMYTLYDIVWGNGWLFLLLLVPVGGGIMSIVTNLKMAKSYDKSKAFGVGLIFLNTIFMCILAFGDAKYTGPDKEYLKGTVIGTCVVGGLYVLLTILVAIAGMFVVGSTNRNENRVDSHYQSDLINEDSDHEEISGEQDNLINQEPDNDPAYQGESDANETEFKHVKAVEIGADDHPVTAYVLSEGLDVYESFSTGNESGIIHTVSLEDYHESLSDVMDTYIGLRHDLYEGIDVYSDFVLNDKVIGDTWEVQQLSYNLTLGGTTYPCFYIVKADITSEGSILVNIIDYNASLGDEKSKEVLDELFKVTGVDSC